MSPTSCTIYLVRHGESVGNKSGRVGGHTDHPLTDKGRDQAAATGRQLADLTFDDVYSSDLQRASETAKIIYGTSVPSDHQLEGLRERSNGVLEDEPDYHLSDAERVRISLPPDEAWRYSHANGWESDLDLATRFIAALTKIGEDNTGKTLLVVAHGAAIRTMLMKLLDTDHDELPAKSFKNAGYVELVYNDNGLHIEKVVGIDPELANIKSSALKKVMAA